MMDINIKIPSRSELGFKQKKIFEKQNEFLILVNAFVIFTIFLFSNQSMATPKKAMQVAPLSEGRISCTSLLQNRTDSESRALKVINDLSLEPEPHVLVKTQLDYAAMGIEGIPKYVSQSADGHWLAMTSEVQGGSLLTILSLISNRITKQVFFTATWDVHFISGKNQLLVSGSKPSDGRLMYAYLFDLSENDSMLISGPEERQLLKNDLAANAETRGIAERPIAQSNKSTAVAPLKMTKDWGFPLGLPIFSNGFALSPFVRRESLVHRESRNALDLPGSQYHGVSVKQVVEREELPFVFVVQNSTNSMPPTWQDPRSERRNQSTTLFDRVHLKPVQSLEIQGLVPVSINLNPRNSLLALKMVNPLSSGYFGFKLMVVDAFNLQKVLFEVEVKKPSIQIPLSSRRSFLNVGKGHKTSWSRDGKTLAVAEVSQGSLVVQDIENQREIYRADILESEYWPLLAVQFLGDGSLALVRQGLLPQPINEGRLVDNTLLVEILHFNVEGLYSEKFLLNPSRDWRLFRMWEYGNVSVDVFEMQNQKTLAFVLSGQVLRVDRENPKKQSVINPFPHRRENNIPLIMDTRMHSQNVLRFSTDQGLFDLQL